jgi:hypothetical protein
VYSADIQEEKREYSKDKNIMLTINCKNKSIRNRYRGIKLRAITNLKLT